MRRAVGTTAVLSVLFACSGIAADLAVLKTGPNGVAPGDQIAYFLRVQNLGPENATDVTFTDVLPKDATFVKWDGIPTQTPIGPGFTCTTPQPGTSGGSVTCRPVEGGGLNAGHAFIFFIVVKAPEHIAPMTILVNTASVTSSTADAVATNNSATVVTNVGLVDLAMSVSGPGSVAAGSEISYTANVRNHGPDAAVNASLFYRVPEGTTFLSLTAPAGWTCTTPAAGATGDIVCNTPTLAPSAAADITIVLSLPTLTPIGTQIQSLFRAFSKSADSDLTNNDRIVVVGAAAPIPALDPLMLIMLGGTFAAAGVFMAAGRVAR